LSPDSHPDCRAADVLDADWNAMQSPAEMARLGLVVEQIGFRPCAIAGDIAPSLHHRIDRVDARQGALDQSTRTQLPRPDIPL
jgi:hypothetical protein